MEGEGKHMMAFLPWTIISDVDLFAIIIPFNSLSKPRHFYKIVDTVSHEAIPSRTSASAAAESGCGEEA